MVHTQESCRKLEDLQPRWAAAPTVRVRAGFTKISEEHYDWLEKTACPSSLAADWPGSYEVTLTRGKLKLAYGESQHFGEIRIVLTFAYVAVGVWPRGIFELFVFSLTFVN